MEDTYLKIRDYIIDASLCSSSDINDDTLIFDQGYLDSMGLLFLVQFLKDEFQIVTNDYELIKENFESIKAIQTFLELKTNKKEVQAEQ